MKIVRVVIFGELGVLPAYRLPRRREMVIEHQFVRRQQYNRVGRAAILVQAPTPFDERFEDALFAWKKMIAKR
jgi:hypothetical protein